MPRNVTDISVVVPAYRAGGTLAAAVSALLAQSTDLAFEVIVVASGVEHGEALALPADEERLRVEVHARRLGAAAARNRGVAAAGGRVLAFTDADVVVPPDWLDRLVAASSGLTAVVAGAVRNGTPDSAAGTAEYLVQFLDLSPTRPAATADHGATCNLLVPRPLWDAYGPFPETLGGGEDTLLTGAAHRDGRFRFAPGAAVIHVNRTGVREVLAHQWAFGRFTARLARRDPDLRYGWLQRSVLLAPVATAARIASVVRRARAWRPVPRRALLRSAPLVVAALVAWGAGLAAEGVVAAGRRTRPRRTSGRPR